jgi:protein O-GlcNAc transferase
MGHNLWHTLMEIFSMTMSIDVLRITPQAGNSLEKRSFLSDAELANIQVILLDDIEDGPFLDLWSLLSNKPPVRVKDLPNDSYLQNIVVPLPGGSNPFWQGDWSIHSCEDSALLRTFSRRVLSFYGLSSPQPRRGSQLVLTFIDRTSTRRLVNKETFLAELKSKYPRVTVQNYDFAAIPLKQQLKIIQNTDILVGVHGAGLTHGFFLSPRSAVVEILPPKLNHKGFRNVASLMDLGYFSAHGDETPRVKRGWQEEDVYIDNERFMTLMDAAIKSMYNKGERNYDII